MVHALAAFVQERTDSAGWKPADLVRASGLTKQVISYWLNDTRGAVNRLPERKTLEGFSQAFKVPMEFLIGKAIESLGLGYTAGDFVNSVTTASNRELLREIEQRLGRAGGEHADDSASNTDDDPDDGTPAEVIDITPPKVSPPAQRAARKERRKGSNATEE